MDTSCIATILMPTFFLILSHVENNIMHAYSYIPNLAIDYLYTVLCLHEYVIPFV